MVRTPSTQIGLGYSLGYESLPEKAENCKQIKSAVAQRLRNLILLLVVLLPLLLLLLKPNHRHHRHRLPFQRVRRRRIVRSAARHTLIRLPLLPLRPLVRARPKQVLLKRLLPFAATRVPPPPKLVRKPLKRVQNKVIRPLHFVRPVRVMVAPPLARLPRRLLPRPAPIVPLVVLLLPLPRVVQLVQQLVL